MVAMLKFSGHLSATSFGGWSMVIALSTVVRTTRADAAWGYA